MANADGGMLAIGISDKTRKIEGVNQHAEKLNELLRVPFDFCNPSVPVTCRYMDCIDNDGNPNRILIMDIPASQFLHTNQADEAYVRVGDKSRKLTFDERMQLMYDKGERFTMLLMWLIAAMPIVAVTAIWAVNELWGWLEKNGVRHINGEHLKYRHKNVEEH